MKLLLALVLLCGPTDPKPFTAKGNTKRQLQLSVEETKMQLTDNKGEVWTNQSVGHHVLFAADDSWVALRGPDPTGDIQIAFTTRDSVVLIVSPFEQLTDAEKEKVPKSNCGPAWFDSWSSSKRGLKLTIAQTGGPKVTLYVSPDGTTAR